MPNDPQVPWTDEQSARVNQVVQRKTASLSRCGVLPAVTGPLPPDADFVRQEIIPSETPPSDRRRLPYGASIDALSIEDRTRSQLATLQVKVRGAQRTNGRPGVRRAIGLVRRAANINRASRRAVDFGYGERTPTDRTHL